MPELAIAAARSSSALPNGHFATDSMVAMQLDAPGTELRLVRRSIPQPIGSDVLVAVAACGVCRTDLHIVDGELQGPLPIVPGHEIVGRIVAAGPDVRELRAGDRIGVPWLGGACGTCFYCRDHHENLCDAPVFTGFTRDGGYATHCLADSRFCLRLPDVFSDVEAAPLLCAGLIGYRALRLAGDGKRLGLYGFGAAAHIVAQVAIWQHRKVYAFTKEGDEVGQKFALSLGCAWAGGSDQSAPDGLDAAIIFAPAGELVPQALRQVRKGGRVICAGIHMSDIPAFPYDLLWGERSIMSVANLTRDDGREFLDLAARVPVRTRTTCFALSQANEALALLRAGGVRGAAVLVP